MKTQTTKEKEGEVYTKLKGEFGYKNKMASPKLTKVVISVGVGNLLKKDRTKGDFVNSRLGKITGQKSVARGAKKAIATFKSRQGDIIGYMVTLRGKRMFSFLEKLLNVALPRTKDFRGINRTAVDEMGNLTIGIKEHTIFPETADEELKDVFGMAITLVSTAKSKKEGMAFYEVLGVPFKRK